MPTDQFETRNDELLTYVVASGDMRFIEINRRVLMLRQDPALGPVVRAEVADCGPECYADLGEALLEYVMSCGDCREASLIAQAADRFGRELGGKLIEELFADQVAEAGAETFVQAMTLVLNSMVASFKVEQFDTMLRLSLDHCPLHAAARRTGMTLWIAPAHRAFVSTTETLLRGLAPGWKLLNPAVRESEEPISEIVALQA